MRSIAHSGPAASAGVAATQRAATDKGNVRVTDMVRTDVQSQKLQSFFETATQAGPSDAAAVALSSVPRKRKTTAVQQFDPAEDERTQHPGQQHRADHLSGATTDVLAKLQGSIESSSDEGECRLSHLCCSTVYIETSGLWYTGCKRSGSRVVILCRSEAEAAELCVCGPG